MLLRTGRVLIAGGYTLTTTSAGLTGGTSTAFDVVPAEASHLVFATQPSDAVAGAVIAPPIRVTVLDTYDNLVTTSSASITMALSNAPAGASLSGATTGNAVSRVATFANLRLDRSGVGYRLAASMGGVTGVTSNAFDISAGVPAKLVFVTEPSGIRAGESFGAAVRVGIFDANDNVVSGATGAVSLTVANNPGGASLLGSAVVNAVSGIATCSDLSLDKVGVAYTLSAGSGTLMHRLCRDRDQYRPLQRCPLHDTGDVRLHARRERRSLRP